jgi:hypothetical protein
LVFQIVTSPKLYYAWLSISSRLKSRSKHILEASSPWRPPPPPLSVQKAERSYFGSPHNLPVCTIIIIKDLFIPLPAVHVMMLYELLTIHSVRRLDENE